GIGAASANDPVAIVAGTGSRTLVAASASPTWVPGAGVANVPGNGVAIAIGCERGPGGGADDAPANGSSNWRYSLAEPMRSAASFASPRRTTSSSSGGTARSGASSAKRGGSRLTCDVSMTSGSLSLNGGRPTSISYSTTLVEYRSATG